MSKVLVVDDDAGITILLQRIISRKGHEIVIARNGWEGLTRAQTELPDLIFTDVRMPDLGGVELAAFLKADSQLSHIPVIILSGTAYLLDLENTAADAILTKPFDLKAVYAILDRFLPSSTLTRDGSSPPGAKNGNDASGSSLQGLPDPSSGYSSSK